MARGDYAVLVLVFAAVVAVGFMQAIALGTATGGEPLPAALAATFGASLGFMMPVSTPCNAIVYGSGRIPLRSMMAAGVVLDVAGIAVITAAMIVLARFT